MSTVLNAAVLTALLALSAAVSYGAGDFTGGLAARRAGAFRTVLVSYTVGLLALVIVALARGEAVPSRADVLWGAVSGLAGVVGFLSLMRGLSQGQMGVVSPVSAVLATSIPVIVAALTEGMPGARQWAGFAVALGGIWLLSRPQSAGAMPGGFGVALLAGVGFAVFFLAVDRVSESAVFWPLVIGRVAAVGVMAPVALARRQPVLLRGALLALTVVSGLLDVGGNLLFLLAAHIGRLDVAAVLSSLYPAVTALLAWLISGEHMTRLQVIGAAAAIAAIVLITM